MEISILGMMLAVNVFLLYIAYKRNALLWYLFSGVCGLITCLSIISSGNQIIYVSYGTTVLINLGGFFLLLPVLLTLISFIGLIQGYRRIV
jgi:hypothetical protein